MDDATARLFREGRLEQVCPKCGTSEAAGPYCTRDANPTGEAHWFRNGDQAERSRRQEAAASGGAAPAKRPRSRPGRALTLGLV